MKRITVIDYGAGNIRSIERALKKIGYSILITEKKKDILEASNLILPGVGAFKQAMDKLIKLDIVDAIKNYCKSGNPFLGICLGMQLLCSNSNEFGQTEGLDIISGTVKNISEKKKFIKTTKIPIIGWHQVKNSKKINIQINEENNLFYHVHSFYCDLQDEENNLFHTEIDNMKICTGLNKENVFGFQFHPEKSREQGIDLLKKFCQIH